MLRNAGGVTQYWANGRAIGRVRQVALPPMRIMRSEEIGVVCISSFNKGLAAPLTNALYQTLGGPTSSGDKPHGGFATVWPASPKRTDTVTLLYTIDCNK